MNTMTIQQAMTLHQWVCALDSASDPEHLEASARDLIDRGGLFALRRGAEAYRRWFSRLLGRVGECHLTRASGADDWWWEGIDRTSGALLREWGAIEGAHDGSGLPAPAPLGLDYGDLMRGVLRAASLGVSTRHCDHRASGGRSTLQR